MFTLSACTPAAVQLGKSYGDFDEGGTIDSGADADSDADADTDADADVHDYGNGADGPLDATIATDLSLTSAQAYGVVSIERDTVTIDAEWADGILSGDEVLVADLHGSDADHANVGAYAFARVASVDHSQIHLAGDALAGIPLDGQAVLIQRVPNFTDVTVSGSIAAPRWDGRVGGIIAFRASGSVHVANGASITADARGYHGGATGTAFGNDGFQGESYAGAGEGNHTYGEGFNTVGGAANNWGGGGAYITGAGGNYAGGATAGASWDNGATAPPTAGAEYGLEDLSLLFFGSGGGGCWDGYDAPGPGGSGGGIVFIAAKSVQLDGTAALTARGGSTSAWGSSGIGYGAGGGAGGVIWLIADNVSLVAESLDARGGAGEKSHEMHGGDGGLGRIRTDVGELAGATLTDACAPDAGFAGD